MGVWALQNCYKIKIRDLDKATHNLDIDHLEAGQLLRPLIRTLRRKLEDHLGANPCIKNIRSRGYLLIADYQQSASTMPSTPYLEPAIHQ